MIVHHVLFWLKADTTADQKIAFRKGLETLEGVESIKTLHIGIPAPIERAVIDTTYTFSLTVFFDDLAGHDVYQTHPLHLAFLDGFRVYFEKVVIYDAE
ncbi:Stress responsive A/B Barrel Domain [Mucilaginibacter sp. OK268]|uniref:Dabb family protein n=1 Tax=Mucilaginibacter sp. OK268 TaxID=1881048 RepID=UPI000880507E|nr:Dabb family protein [Mucilaginibacter sp. OK268]SDP99925.1 Stress responsive A/B Barrel Domain [Mucilaginibacter sp. OK268]